MTLFVYKQDFYVVAMPSEGGRAEGKNPLGAVEKVGADHKKRKQTLVCKNCCQSINQPILSQNKLGMFYLLTAAFMVCGKKPIVKYLVTTH